MLEHRVLRASSQFATAGSGPQVPGPVLRAGPVARTSITTLWPHRHPAVSIPQGDPIINSRPKSRCQQSTPTPNQFDSHFCRQTEKVVENFICARLSAYHSIPAEVIFMQFAINWFHDSSSFIFVGYHKATHCLNPRFRFLFSNHRLESKKHRPLAATVRPAKSKLSSAWLSPVSVWNAI